MNEYTISKIQIYKADVPKWKNAILQVIPTDQLPVHFGGTLADPDGNPKLTSKVRKYNPFLLVGAHNVSLLINNRSTHQLKVSQTNEVLF